MNLLKYYKIKIQYYNYNKAPLLHIAQQTMYNSNKFIMQDLIGSTFIINLYIQREKHNSNKE